MFIQKGHYTSNILPFTEKNILSFNLPTLIHFLGIMSSSCAHSSKSLSRWLVCLFDTCWMKDFHLAKIKSWKPGFVEVEHQKMWFFTAFTHCAITSQPFCLLAARSFLTNPFATCHWSKKWVTVGWHSLIHLAIPLWRSETKTLSALQPSVNNQSRAWHLLVP